MSGEPLKKFPPAKIAIDNGDLHDIDNLKLDVKTGAKLAHALGESATGVVYGNEETNASFDVMIPATGPGRPYFEMMKQKLTKQIRIKIPNKTVTVTGVVESISLDSSSENPIKMSVNFIGRSEIT